MKIGQPKTDESELIEDCSFEANSPSEPGKILFKSPQIRPLAKPQISSTIEISNEHPLAGASKCYKPPEWALPCPLELNYFIEVIKNGTPLPDDTIHLAGINHCILGRQPTPLLNPNLDGGKASLLLHPSISRAHAVLQYGCNACSTPGWYLFDFDSTHGTFINKHRVPPGRYIRLRVGYVLRFGSSTRLLILNGPETDMEEETKESFSALIAKKKAKLANIDQNERKLKDHANISLLSSGAGTCNWGISDDIEEENNSEIMLQRLAGGCCLSHEKNYIEDPKKALKVFFDREGLNPEYEFVEGKFGQQICRIELALENGTVYAEAPLTGRKKKEAIAACALEACRILDRLGQFDANRESAEAIRRAREKTYWQENDYYSSDEDTFFDRTGQIEVRRRQRMRRLGIDSGSHSEADFPSKTEDERQDSLTLLVKLEELGKEMIKVEDELNAIEQALKPAVENASEMDELEAYMEAIKNGAPKRAERQALKRRLAALRQTEVRLLRRAGIRTTPICFSSATSTVSAAVRAAIASVDKANMSMQDLSHMESKLNPLKRQLPKITASNLKNVVEVKDEVFVPDADEEEEQFTDASNQVSIRLPEKYVTRQRSSSPDSESEPSEKRRKEVEIPEISTRTESPKDSVPFKIVQSENKSPHVESAEKASLSDVIEIANRSSEGSDPVSVSVVSQPSLCLESETMALYDENMDDPNFALWLPPPDQIGDGMTDLNKKYGY